jgi:hypothetical protein
VIGFFRDSESQHFFDWRSVAEIEDGFWIHFLRVGNVQRFPNRWRFDQDMRRGECGKSPCGSQNDLICGVIWAGSVRFGAPGWGKEKGR